MAIRVLLADDHPIFREGLRRILEEDGRIEVVAEAANGLEAIDRAAETRPDICIMDVGMDLTNGVEATRRVARRRFGRVVVLSVYEDEDTVTQAVRAGAKGYVLKKDAGRDLLDALVAVQRGEVFLSPSLPQALRRALTHPANCRKKAGTQLSGLTPRQRQVLQLVAEGHTNKRIASLLGLAVETVKSHRKNLMRELGIRSVARLTRFAIQAGLVRPPVRDPGGAPPTK